MPGGAVGGGSCAAWAGCDGKPVATRRSRAEPAGMPTPNRFMFFMVGASSRRLGADKDNGPCGPVLRLERISRFGQPIFDLRLCRSGPCADELEHVESELLELARADAGYRDQCRLVGGQL